MSLRSLEYIWWLDSPAWPGGSWKSPAQLVAERQEWILVSRHINAFYSATEVALLAFDEAKEILGYEIYISCLSLSKI